MTEATGRAASPASSRNVHIVRRLDAPPERVYRAWAHPEELVRWFPQRVEGSLMPGTRSVLVWPDQRVWWDVISAEPYRRLVVRWPWLPDESYETQFSVLIEPRGYGSRLTLDDGPFDVGRPEVLDAYARACEGWAEALAMLRAQLDFSVDLREAR